ncbi:DUF427 domain-containing protein [bacterium SCSIO 12741]|nr:DUF427 domain-containing protein [bacterium SCSIO 12741]
MKAIWKDTVIAESNDTINVEGNPYFPPESVKQEYLVPSETHTVCHWKGTASYYSIKVGEDVNQDAAWYYPETSEMAKGIKGRIAFWKGVQLVQ